MYTRLFANILQCTYIVLKQSFFELFKAKTIENAQTMKTCIHAHCTAMKGQNHTNILKQIK